MVVSSLATNTLAQSAYNALGIYTDPSGDPTSSCFESSLGTPFTAYLVLTNPINNEFDGCQNTARPIQQVSGFECRITMPNSQSFFMLEENIAGTDFIDCQNCRPNYTVCFTNAVPVLNNALVLVTWTFLVLAPGTYDIFMAETQWPTQPSALLVIDAEDPQDGRSAVVSSTLSEQVPVFSINDCHISWPIVVPNTAYSWGSIKSLYR